MKEEKRPNTITFGVLGREDDGLGWRRGGRVTIDEATADILVKTRAIVNAAGSERMHVCCDIVKDPARDKFLGAVSIRHWEDFRDLGSMGTAVSDSVAEVHKQLLAYMPDVARFAANALTPEPPTP